MVFKPTFQSLNGKTIIFLFQLFFWMASVNSVFYCTSIISLVNLALLACVTDKLGISLIHHLSSSCCSSAKTAQYGTLSIKKNQSDLFFTNFRWKALVSIRIQGKTFWIQFDSLSRKLFLKFLMFNQLDHYIKAKIKSAKQLLNNTCICHIFLKGLQMSNFSKLRNTKMALHEWMFTKSP